MTHRICNFLQNGTAAKIIDADGKDHSIELCAVDYYIAQKKHTVKVEGLEQHFAEFLPNTVHCYVAHAGAPSFAEHQDPYDVQIQCIEGTKIMMVNGVKIVINQGESIIIAANTPHQAINQYDSVMLSIGHEQ